MVQKAMYTVKFSPEDEELIESYGQLTGMTVSEIIHTFAMERIEDEVERLSLE